MTKAWRIVTAKYQATAFDGEGARLYGGRWTSPGHRAVYCASSISLATLEILVHLPSAALLNSYRLISVEIPDSKTTKVDPTKLPKDWNKTPSGSNLQHLGDQWLASNSSLAWIVPSAVVPFESNFILNPGHPDFGMLRFGSPLAYPIDPRLVA